MKRLTNKQHVFSIHFAHLDNASEAYRLYYNTDNMKPETIHRKAHELAHNGKIRAMVEQLRGEEMSRINLEHAIEKDKVIRECLRLAFADVRKLFDKNGQLKDVHDLGDETAAAIASIEVTSALEGQIPTYTHKIKMIDKRGPLKDVAKMLGLFEKDNSRKGDKSKNLNLQVNFVSPGESQDDQKVEQERDDGI